MSFAHFLFLFYMKHYTKVYPIANYSPSICRWQEIVSLQVIGGNLDHTDSQVLRENGGKELVISLLNQSGRVRSKTITSTKIF